MQSVASKEIQSVLVSWAEEIKVGFIWGGGG